MNLDDVSIPTPPATAPPPPFKPPTLAYIVLLVIMALIGIVAVLGITLARPHEDNTQLIATIVGMLAPTTAVIVALVHNAAKIQEVHLTMNSRLDQLVAAKELVARSQGVEEGRLGVDVPVAVQIRQPPEQSVPVVLPAPVPIVLPIQVQVQPSVLETRLGMGDGAVQKIEIQQPSENPVPVIETEREKP